MILCTRVILACLSFLALPGVGLAQSHCDSAKAGCAPACRKHDASLPETAEFQQLANRWMELYNKGEGTELGMLYAGDADYISAHVPGLVAHGREKIAANFQKGMNGGGHIAAITVLSIEISGDLSYVLCRYDAVNSGVSVSGRTALIARRIDGVWRIKAHLTVVKD